MVVWGSKMCPRVGGCVVVLGFWMCVPVGGCDPSSCRLRLMGGRKWSIILIPEADARNERGSRRVR